MAIAGNLKTMELAELLQWLSGAQKTGTLEVDSGRVKKGIVFRDGRIIASSSTDPREQLGAMLVSHGYVTDQELAEAIEIQREQKLLLGEILVAAGALTESDLERILRLKAEEILYDVFTWPEGEFRFRDRELPPPETLVAMALDVPAVVLEGMQRIDEWQRIRERIPDADCVPVAVGGFDESTMDEWDRAVLAFVDDDRSLADICRETRAAEFHVCRVLLRQALAGRLKLVRPRAAVAAPAPPEAPASPALVSGERLAVEAQQRLAKGELDVALRYVRAARLLEPDHRRVAAIGVEIESAVRRALERAAMKPTDVPSLTRPLGELAKLHLSPQEGFLLSRIDGVQNLAGILKMGPMNPTDAQLLLHKLITAGHVQLGAKA